jgi:hypothetical protein
MKEKDKKYQRVVTPQLDGQHCPLRTYHDIFFEGGETSEDINSLLFLMKKKGLINVS